MTIAARAAVVSKLKLIHLYLCIYLYRGQTWTWCHNRWRACTTRHRARCASAWLRKSLLQTWLREWCSPLSFHPPHLLSHKPYTFIPSLTRSVLCSINQSSISRSLWPIIHSPTGAGACTGAVSADMAQKIGVPAKEGRCQATTEIPWKSMRLRVCNKMLPHMPADPNRTRSRALGPALSSSALHCPAAFWQLAPHLFGTTWQPCLQRASGHRSTPLGRGSAKEAMRRPPLCRFKSGESII